MTILGLHHITLGCADAQRTIDFYTGTLGLRFVKKTVNFDDPGAYHLYFGDGTGRPGTLVTFFEWPQSPRGYPGIGGTHHFALQVPEGEGLLRWKRRLTDAGVHVEGPYDRSYYTMITFNDPDGTIVEIATRDPGWTVDEAPGALGSGLRPPPPDLLAGNRDEMAIRAETWPDPVPRITPQMALTAGMHHITAIGRDLERTHEFYGQLLGMRLVKRSCNYDDPDSAHWTWGVDDGPPGTLVSYYERDPVRERHARIGTGQTHHFALAVESEAVQREHRDRLVRAGHTVTPVLDRVYFKSIYTQDPDGHIVELATLGPGFLVDESEADLGRALQLPPWLEDDRERIEASLKPVVAPAWKGPS